MPRLVPQEDELAALGAAGALQYPVSLQAAFCQLLAKLAP